MNLRNYALNLSRTYTDREKTRVLIKPKPNIHKG